MWLPILESGVARTSNPIPKSQSILWSRIRSATYRESCFSCMHPSRFSIRSGRFLPFTLDLPAALSLPFQDSPSRFLSRAESSQYSNTHRGVACCSHPARPLHHRLAQLWVYDHGAFLGTQSLLWILVSSFIVVVRIAKWIEHFFGRLSDGNLCVTLAMKDWLKREWDIDASVLYDRAPQSFHRASLEEKHALFSKLPIENVFTEKSSDGCIHELPNRPALLVSSTSWTPDEDFSILLSALKTCDARFEGNAGLRVVCIVTGVGPLREYYETLFHQLQLRHTAIYTLWLEYADYPVLLGSADLGVCLHTSSSGLDLPMKVVDMFGAGLPVCAAGFPCIGELVKDETNGLVFANEEQLADQLWKLLKEFPKNQMELNKLRSGVVEFQKLRWEDNWRECAKPVIL